MAGAKSSGVRLVSSSELAATAGVTLATVHYYTALGLLQVRRRTGNKHLYDSQEATARLQDIARLRHDGYSLALIRRMLSKEAREA